MQHQEQLNPRHICSYQLCGSLPSAGHKRLSRSLVLGGYTDPDLVPQQKMDESKKSSMHHLLETSKRYNAQKGIRTPAGRAHEKTLR
jgi:hypothetical protein